MRVKIYCDLYISGHWMNKKDKLVEKLHKNRLQPMVYVITLSQGEQNHLEFFPSILLKQHVFDHAELFVTGIADGYDGALDLVEQIAEDVYTRTGQTDIRSFILERQKEFEMTGRTG